MKNYMFDKEFLKQLDYQQNKEIYIRITALTNDEFSREEIIGRATGGSVSVDGASAVRRTCSLSMVALETDPILTDTYWCYNNKFKLEIGSRNLINKNYPDIIWFDMGIYVITSFSKNRGTNSLTISISGKDKMCRLNGEVSGTLMMSTDFGVQDETFAVEEEDDKGNVSLVYHTQTTKLPIYTIIKNAIKEYGQERPENIIINDLDQYGYELWEYRGDEPMYLFIDPNTTDASAQVLNMTFNGDTIIDIVNDGNYLPGLNGGSNEKKICLKDLNKVVLDEDGEPTGDIENPFQFFSMNTLDPYYNNNANKIYWGEKVGPNTDKSKVKKYYVAKIEYGDTAGYHRIPLVYNTDLILNAGETITSLLDKLKAMLGDFEYFYDLQGRFVFQKKNTYIQELFSPMDGELATPTMYATPYSYRFEDEKLFTAIANTPNIGNLKNDFSIWGTRKSATGDDLPIHARYALDKKPNKYVLPYTRYTRYNNLCYIYVETVQINNEEEFEKITSKLYYKEHKKDKDNNLIENDYQYIRTNIFIKKNEDKGIEDDITTYYKIVERDVNDDDVALYKRDGSSYISIISSELPSLYYKTDEGEYNIVDENTTASLPYYYIKSGDIEGTWYVSLDNNEPVATTSQKIQCDWRELIYQMAVDFYRHNQEDGYLITLEESNPWFIDGKTGYEQYYSDMQAFWRQLYCPSPTEWEIDQYGDYYDINGSDGEGNKAYWNKKIHLEPTTLNFWIDFLDSNGQLGNYSVQKIGARSKAINDSAVKSIYLRETPEVLFIVYPEELITDDRMAYMPIWIQDNISGLFYRSAQGNSAINKANELIFQHVALVEGISLTSIPIYYLEPNTRIYVQGQGDYTLDKITYSLTYNGTMSLSGNKIIKQFY